MDKFDIGMTKWYQDMMVKHESEQAKWLGQMLHSLLKPSSVIDLGCGAGLYLQPFKEHGARVYGVDLSPYAGTVLSKNEFDIVDLSKPFNVNRKYDLAICLEVGQDMPAETHAQLVENVAKSSDQILFSSGAIGQGGAACVAEVDKYEWFARFATLGFKAHDKWGDLYQGMMDNLPILCGWLPRNSMLLARDAK